MGIEKFVNIIYCQCGGIYETPCESLEIALTIARELHAKRICEIVALYAEDENMIYVPEIDISYQLVKEVIEKERYFFLEQEVLKGEENMKTFKLYV